MWRLIAAYLQRVGKTRAAGAQPVGDRPLHACIPLYVFAQSVRVAPRRMLNRSDPGLSTIEDRHMPIDGNGKARSLDADKWRLFNKAAVASITVQRGAVFRSICAAGPAGPLPAVHCSWCKAGTISRASPWFSRTQDTGARCVSFRPRRAAMGGSGAVGPIPARTKGLVLLVSPLRAMFEAP